MRLLHVFGLVLAIGTALFLSAGVSAEIYRWVDEQGRVHFTQDLGQVPPAQRRAAESAAKAPKGESRIQVYRPPAAMARPDRRTVTRSASAGGRVHKIKVQRAGSSMRVRARINNMVDVPFLIDTGATDVVLPKWAADELGLDLSDARTGVYSTANGTVRQKLVRLDSVALRGARVEDVPATVSESMRTGLLGLSFFNHFKYDIDPVKGVVTLRPNDLAETGVLRGGKSQHQWMSQFASMQARIEHAKKQLDEVPFSRTRRRAAVEARIAELERELTLLEREADDARVPFAWRN